MSTADSWMPLRIGHYLADTMHLTGPEHGAYLLLLMHYWTSGPLPDDDMMLARIARTPEASWRKRIGPIVREFFELHDDDGLLHQKRADIERATAADITEKRQRGGYARHGMQPPANGGNAPNGSAPTGQAGGGTAPNGSANGQHTASTRPAHAQHNGSTSPAHRQHTASTSSANGQHIASKKPATRARATTTDTKKDSPPPSGGPPMRRELIAQDWKPSEAGEARAAECHVTDLAAEIRRFRDYHRAHGNRMADWDAAWRSWCDKAARFRSPRDRPYSPGPRGALEVMGLLDEGDLADGMRMLQ